MARRYVVDSRRAYRCVHMCAHVCICIGVCMHVYVSELSMGNHLRTQTLYKIIVNNLIQRFGDKNRVNSSNFNDTNLKLYQNSISNFRMFFYLETCFPTVTVCLKCRSQAVSKRHVPIYHYLISEWRRNYSTL